MSKSEGRKGAKTRWRRKGIPRSMGSPAEAKALAERALSPSAANEAGHRYLAADAWQFPHPNSGGRELVFTLLIGNISAKSILIPKCGDPQCVNPLHVEIDNRCAHEMKQAGTFDPFVIGADGRPIRRSEYEKSLQVYSWRRTSLDALP